VVSRKALCRMIIFAALIFQVPRAAAFDWDPVTDAEKSMKSNPLDPGAGAVVLFKRGSMEVIERSSLFWTIRIRSYVRIKVFNDAGRDAANVSVEHFKRFRLSKVEGQTVLPTGEVIPLDSSKIFQGTVYKEGKNFALLATNFTLPSVTPGSIIEYQTDEYVDGFYPPTWIFDTRGIGTLESALSVTIGPRLAMAQFPLETTLSKISVLQTNTVKGTQIDYSVKNLRPIQDEPFSPPFRDQAAMVLFTPTQLGFSGQVYPLITKWDDVAEEIKREMGEMEKGDKDLKAKARELAEKLPDAQKKAQAIYSYLQQGVTSSGIVGVGLGRPADEILSAKRGDPDEINALYVLMLREVRVDADMVLVCTQNWDTLVRAFPNFNQFSRIITRLNFKDGPVFVDPADAAAPFGEIPWFERGLQGLAIKGSKIQEADIPAGTMDDNVSITTIDMQIGKDWSTEGDEEIDLKGAEAIKFRANIMNEPPEKLERNLTDYFAYGHSEAEVTKVTHPEFRDPSQPFVMKAHLKDKLINEAGPGALLLNPWMDDEFERPLFKTTVRHSAVKFENPERRVSTSSWQVAPEIKVDQLPKDVNIENDLGGFSHSCAQSGSKITCTRTYYLKKMHLTTNIEYLNAKKFFEDIARQDQEVIVLHE
jgi:transglutaminase-like putative cysteine protease